MTPHWWLCWARASFIYSSSTGLALPYRSGVIYSNLVCIILKNIYINAFKGNITSIDFGRWISKVEVPWKRNRLCFINRVWMNWRSKRLSSTQLWHCLWSSSPSLSLMNPSVSLTSSITSISLPSGSSLSVWTSESDVYDEFHMNYKQTSGIGG